MSVMLVGRVQVKDSDIWHNYVTGVGKSLEPFKAKTVFRGRQFEDIAGRTSYSDIVLIEFRDRETAVNWFKSSAYQALIPIRKLAADVQISLYET